MEDKIFNAVNTLLEDFMQRFCYQLCDMLNDTPIALRPIALAAMQSIVSSNVELMPETARSLYNTCLGKIRMVSLPSDLDPRKNKED